MLLDFYLVRELQDNPNLALVFGFHPLRLPQVKNFSAFLRDTENRIFQKVRDSLVSKLIELKEIKYFWGYRNFVLSDALSELPISEETKGANVVDSKVIIPPASICQS